MEQQEQLQDDDELYHEFDVADLDQDGAGVTVSLVCRHCGGEVLVTRAFDNSHPCSGEWAADGAVWELEIRSLEEEQ
jgi:hypothetical protein